MTEAAAIIGLVASIASLVDLSARVVSRLHDFTSKTSEIPESFRSLLIRLPLLTATLLSGFGSPVKLPGLYGSVKSLQGRRLSARS
jgi:hypothetical protein